LELPDDAPATGPLYLIGFGWMHPTDATVNIAIGQNSGPQPEGMSIEVPDTHGNWITARQGLGFPAGKMKTPAGWKRDYVMIGDGWVKDGDLNTVFSKTVLPLPYHGMKDYTAPPRRLEDDPAYKLHPADWQNFHTRYITSYAFENALRN
jgi:hypothetical protein